MAREDLDFGAARCLNDGHNNIIMGEPITTKLSALGIIGCAALLAATPYSNEPGWFNRGGKSPAAGRQFSALQGVAAGNRDTPGSNYGA